MSAWAWAAGLDYLAAGLHVAITIGGPAWYRAFGAGERMARLAEKRHPWPTLVTLTIAAGLCVFGAYALAAGGLLPGLPLAREGLMAITAVYGLRAAAPLVLWPWVTLFRTPFMIGSSLVCGVYALAHGLALGG